MINVFLSLSTIFIFCSYAPAQIGFAIDPESFDVSYNEDLTDVNDFILEAKMLNSSEITFGFDWEVVNINIPEEWQLSVSDKYISYTKGVTSNELSLELEKGEMDVPYNVHLYPNKKAGCGSWEVLITLESDSTIIIDTIQYEVTVNDDDCMLSGTQEIAHLSNLNVFPNPFSNVINLSADYAIKQITISDLQGKSVFIERGHDIRSINPLLVKGMYMMRVEYVNDSFSSRKIIKL